MTLLVGAASIFLFLTVTFALPNNNNDLGKNGLKAAYVKDTQLPSAPSSNSRITNAQNAVQDQFPYQVSIQWRASLSYNKHTCGGSLLTTTAAITAAHCYQKSGTTTIIAGILSLDTKPGTKQSRVVTDIVRHPDFPGGAVIAPNDLALMFVTIPFTWTSSVQPVSLPKSWVTFSGNAIVSGWGRTSNKSSAYAKVLQYADIPLLALPECMETMTEILDSPLALDNTMVCTSGANEISCCNGDSGGPLVQDGVLVGIVSWGVSPCGWPDAPTVYTRVSSFIKWINDNL